MNDLVFDRSLAAPYGVAERLSPLVQRLLAPNPGLFTFKGTGVHIVGARGSVAVVDPGPDLPGHEAALARALDGRAVSHILITHTHRDHSPAAAFLKQMTGAKTFAFDIHPRSSQDIEAGGDRDFVPDMRVRDGDVLQGDGFTLDCVFTPGHIANHMCYALREERALFSGDHVMGWSTSVVAPPEGDMADYMRSLEKLIARDDAIFYPTHGSSIAEPRDYVRALLAHRRTREAQILDGLAAGTNTTGALVTRLYSGLESGLHQAAALTVQAHLEKLRGEGRAVTQDGRWRLSD